jgi:hypothetical protein
MKGANMKTFYYPRLRKIVNHSWFKNRELITAICGIVENGKITRMSESRFSRILNGQYSGKKEPFTPKQKEILATLLKDTIKDGVVLSYSKQYLFSQERSK